MIKTEILDTIKKEKQRDKFIYPFYGRYSFAEVTPTILSIFDISTKRQTLPIEFYRDKSTGCKKVVVFFVDGFGYEQFVKYQKQFSFLNRLADKGNVYPITTIFPSTTAAALTTIHTGLTPQEHGLPEWYVYFEEFDMVIETLPFRPLKKDEQPDSLLKTGGRPEMLYEGPTIYEKLKNSGVKSFVFLYEGYANSAYSTVSQKGSEKVPYLHGSDLMVKLRRLLKEVTSPAYFFVYWSQIDETEHEFGPHTEEYIAELSVFSHLVTEEFLNKIDEETAKDVLLLLTSDHGQVKLDPKEIIYLNKYSYLVENLQNSKNGKLIAPTGAPRDIFLFIQPEKIKETMVFLQQRLADKAEVMTVRDAFGANLFGIGNPIERFKRRIGNVLVLPYKDYGIWWEHVPEKPFKLLGHHGGLSEEEMMIPFGIARLSDLIGSNL